MAQDYEDDEYLEDEEYLDEELDGEDLEDGDDDENRELVAGLSGWGLSLLIHGVAILVLSFIVIAAELAKEKPPTRTSFIPPPEQVEEEPPEERELKEVDVTIESDEITEDPVVTDLDLPVEETETEDEEIAEVEQPKGREEAVSSAEAGGAAAFMAIGAGGGASGAFGSRSGGGRKRAVGKHGGSRRSESAVDAALRWFKRHQSPDGMWDVDGYQVNCDENPKCEPGIGHTGAEGDVSCTAYALLCFLGAGHDHKTPGKFRKTVEDGLNWLKQQKGKAKTGRNFSGNAYADYVACMAIVEAYGMTQDPELKDIAQETVNYVIATQNKDENGYGLGWNYKPSPTRNDGSVSGWAIMALKSAKAGGLSVGNAMEGSLTYIERAWRAANPNGDNLDPYEGRSGFPYTWNPKTDEAKSKRLACMGALCLIFLGKTSGDIMLETMLNEALATQLPKGYPTNTYYMYYNTLAMFQAGGDRWKVWNNQVRDLLVDSQRKDACFDGSWDWEGTKFHGHDTGRLLSTAYNTLCLEVYYRYAPVAAAK